MSWRMKILKHMDARDPRRVRDYVLVALDGKDLAFFKEGRFFDDELLKEAVAFIKEQGYQLGFCAYEGGKYPGLPRFVCVSPSRTSIGESAPAE
jgi:hypothetical protein